MTSIVSMMTESEITSPTSTTPTSSDLSGSRKLDDKMAYRKSNKPMMEKKRRARINSCLTQLKSLVLQAMKKDNSQYSKLEKADILELTVKHLKNVQRLHNGSATPHVPDAMNKYRAGFNECANEVMRYLGETPDVNSDARTRILSHLATILTPVNSLPLQQTHTPILPAPPNSAAPSSSSSSSVSSSHLQLHHQQQQQLQQQQQSHLIHQALQNHHQQQRHQKDQQLHQQALLAQEALALGQEQLGNVNVQSAIAQACHVTGARNAPQTERNQIIANSPTAFQSPVMNSVSKSSSSGGLQLSCIATTPASGMATGTPLQFVPGALSTGQVAFVLTPQSIPAMNVYTPSVIAASSTVSPEFAMSVLEQQQKQQQQLQQQHRIKQEQQSQLSISANCPELTDAPIALVNKPSKLDRPAPQSSSSIERSSSSSPPISSSLSFSSRFPPSSSSSSSSSTQVTHMVPPPSSSVKMVSHSTLPPNPPYTSKSHREETSPAQTETPGCASMSARGNIEIHGRGENLESARNVPKINKLKRGFSNDFKRENIETSKGGFPTDIYSYEDGFRKPSEVFRRETIDISRKDRTINVQEGEEEEIDMSTKRRRNRYENGFDGVIDYRMTKCSAEVKVKSNPSTWRPW